MGVSEPKQFSGLVVECEDCGFVYSANHELVDGGYDCPQCNEWGSILERNRLKNKIREIEQRNKGLEEENERLREALEHLYELHASRKFVLQDEDYGAIAKAAAALYKAEGRRE